MLTQAPLLSPHALLAHGKITCEKRAMIDLFLQLLGRAIKGLPRQDLIISTKVLPRCHLQLIQLCLFFSLEHMNALVEISSVSAVWTRECSSQVGKYGPGQPVDFGADRVTRSVSESLERLDVEYIDVILVHDVEYADDLQQVSLFAPCCSMPKTDRPKLAACDPWCKSAQATHYSMWLQIIKDTFPALEKLREAGKVIPDLLPMHHIPLY